MQTWIDIITDPHHLLADFLMNVGFEIAFAWVTYLILVKALRQSRKKKLRGRRAKRRSDTIRR
jgi:hypothetical protein